VLIVVFIYNLIYWRMADKREIDKIRNKAAEIPLDASELAHGMLGEGVEYNEPGLVFLLRRVVANNASKKQAALFVIAQDSMRPNRLPGSFPAVRNVLQDTGGSLKTGEWIGIGNLQDGSKFYYGTRGVGKIK
jgi:hypothetical protein